MLHMKRAKDGVRFEWDDGDSETYVTLLAEDDQESIVRKLKRVIALVEGRQASAESTAFSAMAQAAGIPPEALRRQEPSATGNGWAALYGGRPPEMPERLKGEVELIPEGEES